MKVFKLSWASDSQTAGRANLSTVFWLHLLLGRGRTYKGPRIEEDGGEEREGEIGKKRDVIGPLLALAMQQGAKMITLQGAKGDHRPMPFLLFHRLQQKTDRGERGRKMKCTDCCNMSSFLPLHYRPF